MKGLTLSFAMVLLASASALIADDDKGVSAAPARVSHDHTIYVLSGDPKAVSDFHEQIASKWDGGVLIETDKERGINRYWAYGWRTALQSRAFIMPAVFKGLDLQFESYVDGATFPELREMLDQVAIQCGMRSDPFLILPSGDVTLEPVDPDQSQSLGCILSEFRDGGRLAGINLGFLGNEKLAKPAEK